MEKIKSLFGNLKKSTVITLISCGCFIALSFIILCFFIMFPITPSEKVMATFGRESVAKNNTDTAGSVVTTVVEGGESVIVSKGTSKVTTSSSTVTRLTTTHKEFNMTITTGSGFYSGGLIMTGVYPYENSYTTTVAISAEPLPFDPGVPPTTEPAEPYEPPTDVPVIVPDPTEPPVDPGITDPPVDPGIVDPPVDPGITDPPVNPDPPVDTGGDPPPAVTPTE